MEKEIIYINSEKVSCDGGDGALGHPKVYLTIPKNENSITCPYCSRNFILKAQSA